jgi:phenylalanyl-tRNA synthetase beta chain
VRLFELGSAFFGRPEGGSPDEVETVALVAGGELGTPWEGRRQIDFFDLKGVVEALAQALGAELAARPAELRGLAPGAAAELLRGEEAVGYLGRLAAEEGYPLFVAELALAALGEGPASRRVELPSRFPGVPMDLTLTHPMTVAWAEIASALAELAPADLASFALRDRYQGPGVPPGAVATTIAFLYNAADRSLTQEEVNERHRAVAGELERRFGLEAAGRTAG